MKVTAKSDQCFEEALALVDLAASQKETGEITAAIASLRQAYALFAESGRRMPVDPYLILPQYLQAEGQSREAWKYLVGLMTDGFPGRFEAPSMQPMIRAAIYRAMADFHLREDRPRSSLIYAVMELLGLAKSYQLQGRVDDLRTAQRRETIEQALEPFFRQARMGRERALLIDWTQHRLAAIRQLNEGEALDALRKLLE